MITVTPTSSVRNCCVMEVFGCVFMLSIGFLNCCWYKGFRHRTGSDLLLFLYMQCIDRYTHTLLTYLPHTYNEKQNKEMYMYPSMYCSLVKFTINGLFQRIRRCFGSDFGISSCDMNMFCQLSTIWNIQNGFGRNCYNCWYVDITAAVDKGTPTYRHETWSPHHTYTIVRSQQSQLEWGCPNGT